MDEIKKVLILVDLSRKSEKNIKSIWSLISLGCYVRKAEKCYSDNQLVYFNKCKTFRLVSFVGKELQTKIRKYLKDTGNNEG